MNDGAYDQRRQAEHQRLGAPAPRVVCVVMLSKSSGSWPQQDIGSTFPAHAVLDELFPLATGDLLIDRVFEAILPSISQA
jgi:hypothetical protein